MRIVRLSAAIAVLAFVVAEPGYANGDAEVGHRVENLVVAGSGFGELRQVKVHLWYPAEKRAFRRAGPAVYRSRLYGVVPRETLSWEVEAEIARETGPLKPHGRRFPAIVFSHGSTNDPIDYAHTLERIAGKGFVVAAPYHVNNTQDDVRIDFFNALAGPDVPCFDGRTSGCSQTLLPRSMKDRVSDISAIVDELPRWFGRRVDAEHVGVLGHSRGTVTALAAAGGSTAWGFPAEPRVKAIMGMAIGVPAVTFGANVAAVDVPTVLVAALKDANSTPDVSESAFNTIDSDDKLLINLANATHRSFDSTYCAQLQSAGSAFDTDGDKVVEASELANTGQALDRHTVNLIAASPPMGISGKAVHYCARDFFTRPVNIERVVAATPNAEYACDLTTCAIAPPVAGPPSPCVTTSLPCTGLDTGEVKEGMANIAAAFFRSALRRHDGFGHSRWVSPTWLLENVPMVGSACRLGRVVDCPG